VPDVLALQADEMGDAVPTAPGVAVRLITHRTVARLANWTTRVKFDVLHEAESAIGERLKQVSVDDVASILDDRDDRTRAGIEEFRRAGSSRFARLLSRVISASPFPGSSPLGPFADARLRAGWEYLRAATAPQGSALAGLRSSDQMAQADQHMLEIIYDPKTPLDLAEAILSARRLPTALFAVFFALREPSALSRAIITEVADQFATAAKNALRLQLLTHPREIDQRLLRPEEMLTLDGVAGAAAHNQAKLGSVAIAEE